MCNFFWYVNGMYIKKVRKSNSGSKKVYEYLHLVENLRTENGPRQRLILNLGNLDTFNAFIPIYFACIS